MQAEDVVAIYSLILDRGAQIWIGGGWGIDALLGQQTRPHKDLDGFVDVDDLLAMCQVLAEHGFTVKELWSENRWVAHSVLVPLLGRQTEAGTEVATAFVLKNTAGHDLDFHVVRLDRAGNGVAIWDADFVIPAKDLEGRGTLAGTPVRCLSAQIQMATHTDYELQDKDLQDMRFLHERFGIAYLAEHAHRFADNDDDGDSV